MERTNSVERENSAAAMPQVFDYLDYRAFLRDAIAALGAQSSKNSQRWIALRAGFKSTQLLSMILSGQRALTFDRVEPIARVLKLTEKQTHYLETLVELDAAKDQEARKRILERIRTVFHNGLFAGFSDAGREILRAWYLPAIRELVEVAQIQQSPEAFASALGISVEEANEGLAFLEETEFLKREGSRLVRAEPSVHNFGKCLPLSLLRFQMQMLERSMEALSFPKEKKYLESLTLAVPDSLVPKLKEMLKRFFREIDVLVESHDSRTDVWQLNVQLFSLTHGASTGSRNKDKSPAQGVSA